MSASHHAILGVLAVSFMVVTSHAELPAHPMNTGRSLVLDWLDSSQSAAFSGRIAYSKQMRVAVEPGRLKEVEFFQSERGRIERQYEEQESLLIGPDAAKARQSFAKRHEVMLTQNDEIQQYFSQWAASGVEVRQNFEITVGNGGNIRVEFSPQCIDPPTPSLYAAKRIEVRGDDGMWGWSGKAHDPDAGAIYRVTDESLLEQAERDLGYVLESAVADVNPSMLKDARLANGRVTARFETSGDSENGESTSWDLEFSLTPDGVLALQLLTKRTADGYSQWEFSNHRNVNGRMIAFSKMARSGPLAESDVPVSNRYESTRSDFQILEIDPGLTADDEKRFASPAPQSGE